MERVVFTMAFGKPKYAEMAMGLARSLSFIGDTTTRAILTDIDGVDWERYFDVVMKGKVTQSEVLLTKFDAGDHLDAKRVLFIDSDALAFKRVKPIFDAFEGSVLGLQGVWLTEGNWYDKDIADLCKSEGIARLPKFNTGVAYYEPGPELDKVREKMKEVAARYDTIGFRPHRGFPSDEPCVSLAMAHTGIGTVIHDSANFHNSAVGLLGKLRLNVLKNECSYLCLRYDLQRVEPYVFHAHFWAKFRVYWKQLAALKRLERFEDTHGIHYRPPLHSLRRSIQKRWLRLFGEGG